MALDGIFNTTIRLLERNLDLRAKNQNLISGNLANVETPGFIPSTLTFEKELKSALNQRGGDMPSVTNPRHIPLKGVSQGLNSVQGTITQVPDGPVGRDGNGVELEQEMGRLAENQIMYNATVQLTIKKFEGLKAAIKGSI
jgi:flagellar basal-body rod protein FlgB